MMTQEDFERWVEAAHSILRFLKGGMMPIQSVEDGRKSESMIERSQSTVIIK